MDNKDKHGEPLNRPERSGKHPNIANVQQALKVEGESSFSMAVNFDGMKSLVAQQDGNIKIAIIGKVIEGSGVKIMDLQDMIEHAIRLFENLMAQNGLI